MDLSIIIVTFNTQKLLIQCIESVVSHSKGCNYEIIIVDNGSEDDSFLEVSKFKRQNISLKITIVQNKKNVGFAAANNQGMKIAKGRYILLLNSDTLISSTVLPEMISWLDTQSRIGIASCALKNVDGSEQGTGGYFPTLFRVFAWMFFLEDLPFIDQYIGPFHPMHTNSFFYKGNNNFVKAKKIDWVTGAFFMIRRKLIEDIGHFDKEYFMYTEEVDYCYRAKDKNWEVFYNPRWSIVHLGGASSSKEFPILSEYKGVKLFYKKHMPEWQFPILRMLLKAGSLLRMILFSPFKGAQYFSTYAKAFQLA